MLSETDNNETPDGTNGNDELPDGFDGDVLKNDPLADDRPPRWSWFKRLLLICFAIALVLTSVVGYLYHMSQRPPDFYQEALQQQPEEARLQGAAFETQVMGLYNAALQFGPWNGAIHQDQINGWLASELPKKFPEILESQFITDPRVSITAGELSVAGQANFEGLHGVIVARLDIFRTDQKDQFAVRVHSLRAGVFPIPISTFAAEIEKDLARHGLAAQWSEMEGDPVLIVDIPEKRLLLQELYKIEITTIDFEDERMIISGVTQNYVDQQLEKMEMETE